MIFPITRKNLQTYKYVKETTEEGKLVLIIERICKDISNSMANNPFPKRNYSLNLSYMPHQIQLSDYNILVNKLKDVFIGCDITIDTYQTYLTIDWS